MDGSKQAVKTYFTELNGLRGLAAISILLFHSRWWLFKTLWIGVPVFFVLSGFLITRILVESKNESRYFKRFYLRRAFRIFPIYYLVLLLSLGWGYFTACDLSLFPYFLFYLQSFVVSLNMEPAYCCHVFNHTWSLSVEELFYLCWPLVVYYSSQSVLRIVCILVGAASFLYKIILVGWFHGADTDALVFSSLPGSLDTLMAGAWLGLLSLSGSRTLYAQLPKHSRPLAFILFLMATGFYYIEFHNSQLFSIQKLLLYLATLLFSVCCMAWLVSSHTGVGRYFVNTRFVQYSGTISYGLYLYHFVIYSASWTFLNHWDIHLPDVIVFLIQIGSSYLAAMLSWRFIEQPMLRLKDKYAAKPAST